MLKKFLAFFAFLAVAILAPDKAQAQVVFTFECVCAQQADTLCDICPTTNVRSRSFHGLLIRRYNKVWKWIDAPYTIRQLNTQTVQFLEQIPNPESVQINLAQTEFATLAGYMDSTNCQCNCGGANYVAGPGIIISGDTISAVDTSFTNELQRLDTFDIVSGVLRASLLNDGVPFSSVTLPVWNLIAGTGIGVSNAAGQWTISNTSPDQTVSITGAGISVATGTYPNFTITSTEVDGNTANEGVLGVGSGGASSSTLLTNTTGGNPVTINVAGTLSISESTSANGGSVTITGTGAAALSGVVNQVPYFNTTSTITTEAGSGGDALTWNPSNNRFGVGTNNPSDKIHMAGPLTDVNTNFGGQMGLLFQNTSATNGNYTSFINIDANGNPNSGVYFKNVNHTSEGRIDFITRFSGGFSQRMTIAGNGNVGVNDVAPPRTFSVTGEARITDLTTDTPTRIVGADADGDLGAITVSTGLSLSSGNLTATDASVTNEAQTLSVSGTTSGILTLSTAGGAGGGTATIAAGTGITVAQSGGAITITNSAPASGTPWLIDGNTIGTTRTMGSNDNFDVGFETNGTTRMLIDNTGPVTIGSTVSTAAALVVNGLQSNTGFAILGGTGLVSPAYISTRGDGSGSTAQVLDSRHSMIGGTVAAILENTATTGNSNAITSLIVNSASTGDPYAAYTISGGTQWVEGVDNSDSDKFKIRNASTLTTTNAGLTMTTGNFAGFLQNSPTVELEVGGTGAIGMPVGTVAQRPSLTGEAPLLRYCNEGGMFELGDPNKNAWFRLAALTSPTVTVGAAAGTGGTANVTSGAGSNDCSGSLTIDTGTSTGTGTICTVTYNQSYSGTTSTVLLDAGNDLATTQRTRYSCQASNQTQFSIRAVTALDASTTYVIKYYVRNY